MMQDVKVICSDLIAALNASVICVYSTEEQPTYYAAAAADRNATLSDTDPTGAVKFTVAVVLLYGVGVIGLLGITARRNRRVEMMDKEVNKYLKMQHQSYSFKRKFKRRKRKLKAINKLIAALHFQEKVNNRDSTTPTKRLKTCNSWTSGLDVVANVPPVGGLSQTACVDVIDETVPMDNHCSEVNRYSLRSAPLLRKSNMPSRPFAPLLIQKQESLKRIEDENENGSSPERSEADSDFIEDLSV